MAYRKPNDLDGFIQLMPKADMRVKALLAEDLVSFLSDDTNTIVCQDMGMLVDGLMPWLTGSHFKIAQKSLEAFTELIKHLGPDFNAYTATVLPHVIDRLGDSKDTVREKAQLLLQNLMEHKVLSAQQTVDKLAAVCFRHKNSKVREEFLQTVVNALNEYGTAQLTVRNYIQPICALLGDPTATVRDAAVQTLVEIYKHVGDRLRPDLRRNDDVPASKLALLEQKFDQVKAEGLLFKSALQAAPTSTNNGNGHGGGGGGGGGGGSIAGGYGGGHDEGDNISVRDRPSKIVKRNPSASMRPKTTAASSNEDGTGAVTTEIFEASFELVPQLTIFHPKDVDDAYKGVMSIISDKTADWEKRVEALKKVRSLMMLQQSGEHNLFGAVQLKDLSLPFLDIVKEELRSQVIREACITIAYMAKMLRNKLDQFSLYILDNLILLIQNSAKVIASSSTIALKYIVKYVHAPKLIKAITDNLQQSKSKDIRAALCEILLLLFEEWQTRTLERYAPVLRDTIKKSLGDADNEARRHSRRAYWAFRGHFPDMAEQIAGTLDPAMLKALERERDGIGVVHEEVHRRTTVSRVARSPGTALKTPAAVVGGMRSVSAVDTAAAQRAKARAQYAFTARKKLSNAGSGTISGAGAGATGSLPRPRAFGGTVYNSAYATPQHMHQAPLTSNTSTMGRTRGRTGVSQSQPGSRSTSPSTKLREQQQHLAHVSGYYRQITGTIPKKASGIPRSLAGSRETSPTRVPMKRSVYTTDSGMRRTPDRHTPGRQLATARILQQSREAESALADALSPDSPGPLDICRSNDYSMGDYSRTGNTGGASGGGGTGRLGRKLLSRDESDDSEASSVCSDRSFDSSMTRGNNSNYSLSGSRNRLDWSCARAPFDDFETIIQYCASSRWGDRKDGLISLTQYLADGKELNGSQLQSVLDISRKMFMDTHTKVYSLFLDTVTELILAHSADLHDWLFILLTRLFHKLGTDMLNSMASKIWKTLQVVHEYFPTDLQMKDVFRILADTAQTPTVKSKLAILRFLNNLATTYCKNTDFPTPEGYGGGMGGGGGGGGNSSQQVEKAVQKIIQLAGDQKCIELRSQARLCLVALYNCNTPHMTRLMTNLQKGYQDSARAIIQAHLRRSSTSGTNSPSSSPLSSSSPKPLQSPSLAVGGGVGGGGVGAFASLQPQSLQFPASPHSRQASVDHELLMYGDAGDVQHNIHKTSEEIRNCFGGMDTGAVMGSMTNSTRQYYSLSHTAANGYNGHAHGHGLLNDALDSCPSSNSKTQSATTTESNTPESTTMRLDGLEPNHNRVNHTQLMSAGGGGVPSTGGGGGHVPASHMIKQYNNYTISPEGELILDSGLRESDILRVACDLTADMAVEHIQASLSNLGVCIKNGNGQLPNKHFRAIMKMLLAFTDSQSINVVIAALHVLSKIVRSENMRPNWINFLELILLKIINCYQAGKETMREIDALIPRIVPSLPLSTSINIVNPIIATGTYPLNLCAVKMLTELIDRLGSELSESQLDQVFPNVARLTDDTQSMVRKAAVFCIVKLYLVMGEERVKPKLSVLNASKLRLLNVYIDKQRSSSGGGSTKNSSTSSS